MLQELQAQVALELVGLELSAEERAVGLEALPGVLWQEGLPVQRFPRLKLDRASYLKQLRSLTTPAEQVPSSLLCTPRAVLGRCEARNACRGASMGHKRCSALTDEKRPVQACEHLPLPQVALYGGAPSMEAIPSQERYTAAVACIAEGVASRKPALISTALRYLTSYQAAAPDLGSAHVPTARRPCMQSDVITSAPGPGDCCVFDAPLFT